MDTTLPPITSAPTARRRGAAAILTATAQDGGRSPRTFVAERDRLAAELAALRGTTDRAGVLAEAAAFLRDLPAAWEAATPEQRNALARLVFRSVEVTDDRVAAVVPEPDFAPFFVARATEDGALGEHGNGAASAPSSEVMTGRKRRGSVPSPRHEAGPIDVALAPPRRVASRSGRAASQTPRPRKLAPEQVDAIRTLARTKSLRDLAAAFGVSHETVRAVLQRGGKPTRA